MPGYTAASFSPLRYTDRVEAQMINANVPLVDYFS